ncbi:MAG: hypothetical protein EBR26_00385 [Microbacteriaceae bacterium]|nr:hypothetical protein [Microbacteriaceae bacterium]
MKKKLFILVGITLLMTVVIYQATVMLDLQNLRNSVDNTEKNAGLSEIARNVDRATQHGWEFAEFVCPYYSFKYNLSPFFGLPFEATMESSSEKYTYLVFKNDKGQRTYVEVLTSEYSFCGK